ncbi:response regulator [Pedosphaera parvula]|uniref:Response regulator receiver protein n=1 Tax=Pedosphaera parvula (strain Ellin514) TaxID=320771 RepID=B9XDA7_PEDPL|nr:response regulator [Pedosphaera parvula]EEF62053.1 response regulator receiver protein [Pedosphaera parvula Ellin514]
MTKRTILVVEDNPDDVLLFHQAMHSNRIANPIRRVENGLEAVAYLEGKGKYMDREAFPLPCVMFTDLKMPFMNGFELLEWLKGKPEYSMMPVIVFTSFKGEEVKRVYSLGADYFVAKTGSLDGFIESIQEAAGEWWWCEQPALQVKACQPGAF